MPEHNDASISARIASWASEIRAADLPDEVRSAAVTAIVDTVGVMIAGADTRPAGFAHRVAMETCAPGDCQLVTGGALAGAGAAMVNATSAHALDFDDNCDAGVVHASAAVLPAALASVQAVNGDGDALIGALVAGLEAQFALSEVLGPDIYHRGWWTSALLGRAGAAVASVVAGGGDAGCMTCALGLALADAGGGKVSFGTDAKPLLLGRAAKIGVESAWLAMAGAGGPASVVEKKAGLADLIGVDGLSHGRAGGPEDCGWRILCPGIDIKRFPVCLSSHAAIDALEFIIKQHDICPDEIAQIEVDAPPLIWSNLIHPDPANSREAQFSMPFALAATVCFGRITLDTLERFDDPCIKQIMQRTVPLSTTEWNTPERKAKAAEGARIRLRTADGRSFCAACDKARGGRNMPLSKSEIDDKFLACVAPVTGKSVASELLNTLWGVETVSSVRSLLPSGHRHEKSTRKAPDS